MAPTAGSRLGQYEIPAAIGAGGMGEVYRARDTRLGREVALKVLPEAFASDPERMGRFEREAKVLASLNHPNIAAIYGFEDSGSGRALVMELVEGPTLADRICKGAIPIDDALPIAKQIAEGLEYAHERGVVHRDLRPANIKITPDGTVKILDFGLAKAIEGEATPTDIASSPTLTRMATQAGFILGTAAYMSPEQAKGKPVDRRTDIWAFGCVLYEMLTGKQAFPGETVTDVLATVLKSEPDWALLPSATPAHVRVLLRRCLQKDARQRLRDIGDARVSLEEVLSGSPESFSTAGVSHPVARRVLPWAAGGLLAGSLIAGLVVWRFFVPASQQSAMHFSAVTNFAGVQAQPAISPDGRSVAFVSDRDGHYNIYVGLLSGGNLVEVTHDASAKARPAWSPDGATIAYSRINDSGIWDVWEVPALGGTSRRVIQNGKDPAWSPDGASLAYDSPADRAIWIAGASGENAHRITVPTSAFSNSRDTEPRFSPDGSQVAFAVRGNGPYGELYVVDLRTGKERSLTQDAALVLSPVWSPDGRFIYFASSRGGTMNIWKISASGGRPEQITAGQGDDAQLDVSPDGRKLVFSTWRTSINIVEVDLTAKAAEQNPRLLAADPARNQVGPSYSPDGMHLAYFSNLKGAERESIWVSNADGSNPVQLVRDNWINVFPNWAPDSQHLIYQAESVVNVPDQVRTVPVSGGTAETILKDQPDRYFDVGADGRILFRIGNDQVQAFDPRTNSTVTLGTNHGDVRWGPMRWSPDGRLVAYIVAPTREDDPNAGVWVTDFKNAPRQLFRGWADWWIARGPNQQLYFIKGKPDLKAELWKIGWDGQGLTATPAIQPMVYSYSVEPVQNPQDHFSISPEGHHVAFEMIYSYWVDPVQNPQDHFSISPDGRRVAFETQTVVSANIGMIENIR